MGFLAFPFKFFKSPVFWLVALLLACGLGLVSFLFFKARNYYDALPLALESSDLPYINVNIEGNSYPLFLDLGSRLEVDLYTDVLDSLEKSPHGAEKWINCKGNAFTSPTYRLPKLEIGSLTFKNAVAVEFPKEREIEYAIGRSENQKPKPRQTVGYIGRGLLKKVNFLLDVTGGQVVFTNRLEKLKEAGYDLTKFFKVPFELLPKGMVVTVETSLGKKRLIFDTGFTATVLHDYLHPEEIERSVGRYGLPMIHSSHFIMNGTDFKGHDLSFLKMTEVLDEVDGFLGMDFIKQHAIFVDFSKKLLYIQP